MLTRLLKTNNICDIGHVDSTLQLKTSLSFRIQRRLIFLHHKLGLLLVGIDIFATEKYALEEIDMVLRAMSVMCHFGEPKSIRRREQEITYLSLTILSTVSLDNLESAKSKKVSE